MSTSPDAIVGASVAPEAVAEPEIVESPTTVAEPTEPQQTAEPEAGEPEAGGSGDETHRDEPGREDGRVIPPWMRALKESNPQAYAKAKGDLFDLRDRRTVHPTVQAARADHELVESAGGVEGLKALREDGQFFKTAAQQFLKGDPGFVKDLWEEDKIAAALHVSPMLEAFKANDLEGYKSTVARLWSSEFDAVGLPRGLQTLKQAIESGDKETASFMVQQIMGWQNSIASAAQRAEDPRVKTLLAERAQRQENESKTQHDEFLKSYRTEALNAVVEDGSKVFDSFFKDRKIDPEDRTDLLREAFRLANQEVEKDKEFVEQREAHLQAGDSKAAMRLTKARFASVLPNAVKRIARRYGMTSGPAKPSPVTPANGGQPAKPAATGWVAVNDRPNPDEINRSQTTNEMIFAGRAVLKNGRKVSWAHLKRAT